MLLWLVPSVFVTWTKFPLCSCAACGISARWAHGTSAFRSQFCIPGGCVWVFRLLNACSFSRGWFLLSDLQSKKLCMSFPFLECLLLQSGTISALRSIFQEAVREFSVPRTPAPSVGNNFCSQFYIPRSCAWVFRSSNVSPRHIDTVLVLVGLFLLDRILLLILLIPSLTWIDLFLLEGCSAGSITIPYLSCIALGTWLGFAGKVELSEAKRRGVRGGGEACKVL
jgi:hypothetical protein